MFLSLQYLLFKSNTFILRIFITLEFETVYVTDYLNGVKLTSQKKKINT